MKALLMLTLESLFTMITVPPSNTNENLNF